MTTVFHNVSLVVLVIIMKLEKGESSFIWSLQNISSYFLNILKYIL